MTATSPRNTPHSSQESVEYHRNCAEAGCNNTVWSGEAFKSVYCEEHATQPPTPSVCPVCGNEGHYGCGVTGSRIGKVASPAEAPKIPVQGDQHPLETKQMTLEQMLIQYAARIRKASQSDNPIRDAAVARDEVKAAIEANYTPKVAETNLGNPSAAQGDDPKDPELMQILVDGYAYYIGNRRFELDGATLYKFVEPKLLEWRKKHGEKIRKEAEQRFAKLIEGAPPSYYTESADWQAGYDLAMSRLEAELQQRMGEQTNDNPTTPIQGDDWIDSLLVYFVADFLEGKKGVQQNAKAAIQAHVDEAVREATDFRKKCQPYNRERRYEAAIRVVGKLEGKLGKDYSLTDVAVRTCDELERLLHE